LALGDQSELGGEVVLGLGGGDIDVLQLLAVTENSQGYVS